MLTETQTAFAIRLGVAKSYITKLKHDNRLVFTHDNLIDVEASIAKISTTQDPSKPTKLELSNNHSKPDTPDNQSEAVPISYHAARTVKEKYHALSAKLAYEQACSNLLEAADVAAVIARVAVTLRTRFESFPDLLAPQLAEIRDEQQIRSLLADQVEILLSDLSAQFAKLARQAKP